MEATTDTTTPVTTTEAVPAAPATSAPASPATSERPTDVSSLAAYLEKRAATQTAPPAAPTETAATGPAATGKPDGSSPNTEAKGPIPFEVHHTALANARDKAVAEATARFDQEYGWAKQVSRDQLTEFAGLAHRMQTDPIAFLADFVRELETHPTHAPLLRSQAGRILAGARGTPPVDLNPDLVVDDGNGRQIATFSADRVKDIVNHAVKEAIGTEVAPLKQESAARQAQVREAEAARVRDAKVDGVLADLESLLEIGKDTSEDDKKTFYTALDALVAKGVDPYKAAMQVRAQHVEPKRAERTKAQVLDTLNKKAAGNTANGAGTATTPTKLKTLQDIETFLRQRAGGNEGV